MFKSQHRLIALIVCLLAGLPGWVSAFDGYVITIRHQSNENGNIHDGSTPGELVRYDLSNGTVRDSKVLYSATPGITEAHIGPFGQRIAFCRADGTLGIMNSDGGNITELGRFIAEGKMKKGEPASTGLQWPATDGGRWLYYTSHENELKRIDLQSKKHEVVVTFNRAVAGEFALSPDATPTSGYFVKRTDNYAVVIYDLARGDGDLYSVPVWAPGCGIGMSPDGTMFASNDGTHTVCSLVDMHARRQHSFRISEWDGDPTKGVKERAKLGWAWQHFRWSRNDMEWITVKQAPLVGESTHVIQFSDAMLYNWVQKRQINVTGNRAGTFDRPGGAWANSDDQLLGYYRGEAPFTVDIADARLAGSEWSWRVGDGNSGSTGPRFQHTFTEPGVFTVIAQRGDQRYRAQVTVEPRRAPTATVQVVNPGYLLISFDEAVTGDGKVRLADGTAVAQANLSVTGRQLQVALAKPLAGSTQVYLEGFTDLAQQPNPISAAPLEVTVPAWPINHEGIVYRWESARANNVVHDPKNDRVLPSRLKGSYDREGWLRLAGDQAGTGFFAQTGQGMDFHQVIAANRFTMEAVIQPEEQSQAAAQGNFPRRIINCSAWHDGDWNFLLGQQDDKLVASIRTADNFLDMNGNPTTNALHGRAPVIELFTLSDTDPHHVVVTYEPGKLKAYVDGKQVVDSDQVTGDLKWGYGELVFGGSHNSGRQRWRGRMRNMALYARALTPEEVSKHYTIIQSAIRPLPRITVRAELLAVSTAPTPESIAPYTEALIVNEYKVREVMQRSEEWNGPKVEDGQTIRVYQWGLINRTLTDNASLKPGAVRELTLEAYEGHPGKLDEVVTAHELELASDAALLYEPQ